MISDEKVLKSVQRWSPWNAQDMLDKCGFGLKLVGSGQFRDVYKVMGSNLVVKFPRLGRKYHDRKHKINIAHAVDEIVIWQRMWRYDKYESLRKYLPEIIASSKVSGIVLMRQYKMARESQVKDLAKELEAKVKELRNIPEADMHHLNMGFDKSGNPKIIDLGLFVTGIV